jgi:hypothetical protein
MDGDTQFEGSIDKMSAPPQNPCVALDEQTRLPLLHDAYHMNYEAHACSQICLPAALRFTGSKHGVEFGHACTDMGFTKNMVPGRSGPVQFFTFDYSE